MTDFPDLKLKTLVSFPAAVFGGTGLAVRQENGKFYFDLAYEEFATVASLPDATNYYVLSFNTVSKTYVLVPVAWLRS